MINTIMVDESTFQNWDVLEDAFIMKALGIKVNHCFLVSANRDNGNTMYMEAYNESAAKIPNQFVLPAARALNAADWTNGVEEMA